MRTQLGLLLFTTAVVLAALPALGITAVARGAVPHDVAPAAPAAPLDVPDSLVASGVSDYTIAAPKLFWHSGPAPCPPHLPSGISTPQAPSDNFTDSISRIAVQGSLTRTVYFQQLVCDGLAGKIESNIVADANYIYFTKSDALYRLSVNANPGDAPELMNALVSGYAELAIDSTYVYALNSDNNGTVYEVLKSNKARVPLIQNISTSARNLQVSYAYSFGTEDYFVYWLQSGVIHRLNKNTLVETLINPGSTVTGYYAEGGRFFTCGDICFGTSDLVYLSTGQLVKTYNNWNSTCCSSTIYDAGAGNTVYELVTDDTKLFMLQSFAGDCSGFICYTDYVVRHNRGASGSADTLYFSSPPNFFSDVSNHIALASDYVFWQDSGRVLRLPKTAGALPTTNMQLTGLEITQGIQKPDNSVRLIQNKRTFVRLFVKSDGPAVSGITALLDGTCGGSPLESLLPVNDVGTNISVPTSPTRSNLNDGFLFELPWGWTTCGTLNLSGHLNPFHAPPESGYGDNDWSAGPFTFSASPRLQVQFVAWQYVLFNQFHTPLFIRDIMETFSWIRRAYPLNSTPGFSTDSSVGFRPGLWFVGDDSLGNMVRGSAQSCQDLYYKDKDGKQHDDRNLCASRYTNQQMAAMRSENGMPDSLFFYGMLADTKDPGNNWVFPRGQACCGKAVSSGPVGADGSSGYFWYNGDGTYGDWYAAHEIGHTLGRNHPVTKGPDAANRKCGQSEDDSGYPYNYAQIGVDDNTEGFDAGDASLKQPKRVYPGTQWADVMSYCAEQWLSDYTYEAMYQYMTSAAQAAQAPDAVALSGDWLSVQGTIISGTNTASINRIRHLTSVASLPPLVPGGYAIRLLNASNGQLANYLFSGDPLDGQPDLLMFSQVVTFTAGTKKVQIVRTADNTLLTSLNVPSQPPTIGNVALQGAPNPVTGTVTLGWTASDPGGLPLTFDIFYLLTGSPTPQPVKLNVIGASTQIDTTKLGGGTGRLRVVANDGFERAQADSAAFTMASKPPLTIIDTPGSGLRVHYGQVVNFSGEALDYQDGSVTGSGLQWRYQKGVLGTGSGALQSLSNLPVGTNAITLTATNSKGLFASTSITVVVDDDLSLLGSTLTAGPTQFGWTFPAGATHVQTATLHIDNAGAGTLNWNATSDASWLTLSASSGTAPSSVVVTANPNGIPANTGLSGHISLSASGQPTITIPAGIVVGNLEDLPIAAKPSFIYLPLVER